MVSTHRNPLPSFVNQRMVTANSSATILIADDSRVQRTTVTTLLQNYGYTVVSACNGQEAVALFDTAHPDLVILDIVMPIMDGVEAAKLMRASARENYIPIVFISGTDNDSHLDNCIAAGGDDFISKPFNNVMMLAKINSLLRVRALYQEQVKQKRDLLKYQAVFDQEQQVAASLYKNILQADFAELPNLRYILSPMALFNGDILLSAKAPTNYIYILLGDFTGHGLSASIGAGPVADIFYGMVRKGFSAKDIIKEINKRLVKLLPVNMFLGATLITLKPDESSLELITCGLPEHFLVNQATKQLRTIVSKNLPLGIIPSLEPEIQYFKINKLDALYLFTDGVIEAENTHGEPFGTLGIVQCLQTALGGTCYDAVLQQLQQHCSGIQQQDDVTFVELQCNTEAIDWENPLKAEHGPVPPLEWRCQLDFSLPAINNTQPVPIIINLLMDIQSLQPYRATLFCILNELFMNALDYGLLALDPSLKRSYQGLVTFYQLKAMRLSRMDSGNIRVSLQHSPIIDASQQTIGGRLNIEVQDSGEGFDYSQLHAEPQGKATGLQKIRPLCTKLAFLGSGNTVQATFEWPLDV